MPKCIKNWLQNFDYTFTNVFIIGNILLTGEYKYKKWNNNNELINNLNSINKHTHSEKVCQTPFVKTCECKKGPIQIASIDFSGHHLTMDTICIMYIWSWYGYFKGLFGRGNIRSYPPKLIPYKEKSTKS